MELFTIPLIVDVLDVVMFDVVRFETDMAFAVIVPCVDKLPVLLFMNNLQTDGAAPFEYTNPVPYHELIAKLKLV